MSALEAAPIPTLSSKRERPFLITPAAVQCSDIVDFMVMMPLGPFPVKGEGFDTVGGKLDDADSEGCKIQRPDDGMGSVEPIVSRAAAHMPSLRGGRCAGLPVLWQVSL